MHHGAQTPWTLCDRELTRDGHAAGVRDVLAHRKETCFLCVGETKEEFLSLRIMIKDGKITPGLKVSIRWNRPPPGTGRSKLSGD